MYNTLCKVNADLAHPVERHLAKVKVASSSLVIRSTSTQLPPWVDVVCFLFKFNFVFDFKRFFCGRRKNLRYGGPF